MELLKYLQKLNMIKKVQKYFLNIKNTLLYFDFEPLLFMWVASDILNNMVLWTSLSYWEAEGQPYTYWLYFAYLIGSIGMMVFLHNKKWLANFITYYLIIYLFSTIRYLVNIFGGEGEPFTFIDAKNILITCWYASMWVWILFKVKKEILHKSL
jgi:hypothetical protein|tara:strand:- start:116 stop:577 length:462 start_codon:yes stop_codon:yes gene_type:complete